MLKIFVSKYMCSYIDPKKIQTLIDVGPQRLNIFKFKI